jgi:hypothetical protein
MDLSLPHRLTLTAPAVLALLGGLHLTAPALGADCPLFVLQRDGTGYRIARQTVPEGGARLLDSNPDTGIIAAILPPAPGGSGSVESLAGGRTIQAACNGREIRLAITLPDGKTHQPPGRTLDDLSRYDVRVSVTSAEGARAAFRISRYSAVDRDEIAPVLDPFAGAVPLQEHDYVVFTQTFRHRAGAGVTGQTAVAYDGQYLVTRGAVTGGPEGDFLIDLAAGTSVLTRTALPAGTAIEEASMTEYSTKGVRKLAYSVQGATGDVSGFLGLARLPGLQLGSLRLPAAKVPVMEELPRIGGREIAGILGTDLLFEADRIVLRYGPDGLLRLASTDDAEAPGRGAARDGKALQVPFSLVDGKVFLKGRVKDLTVHFILDTGSPTNLLDRRAADALGLELDGDSGRTVRGLDGEGTLVRRSILPELVLGEATFREIPVETGDLVVLQAIRHGQYPGLIGNAFLSRFRQVELDLEQGVMRLEPVPDPEAAPASRPGSSGRLSSAGACAPGRIAR